MPSLRIPTATYRLQFNGRFRFENARALADYFHQVGVTDIYASPLLQARRGSSHGYDVTDPTHLNSEIGTEQEFEALNSELRLHGIGLLLDIVPNHLAAASESPWWTDVLASGSGSAYAPFFDIDWHPPRTTLHNRVLLPILGRPYAQALENKELRLTFDRNGFFIQYFDISLPLSPKSSLNILQHRVDELRQKLGPDHPAFREWGGIAAAVASLPEGAGLPAEKAGERRLQKAAIKERLWKLYEDSSEVREFLDENLRIFNGRKGQPASFQLLDRLLSGQAYVVCYWQSANAEINYRRFFTITDLVGVRVEDPLVFDATHAVILRLIEKDLVTGLRIDHIDGLRDPLAYLQRLQERIVPQGGRRGHPGFYVLVEKILAPGEKIPRSWPTCGTTGYDFLNTLNGIFVDAGGCQKLEAIYHSFIADDTRFEDLVYRKKKQVMGSMLAVEMRALGHHLGVLAEQDRYGRELPQADLTRALVETTACLPVYRTYARSFDLRPVESAQLKAALEEARRRNPGQFSACFDFLGDVLLLREKAHVLPEQGEARLAFVVRWQQFTGPIMAKAVEDSAFYVYNRLVSLNEVGGRPDAEGLPVEAFHEFCRQRQSHFRHTLNATSTHDTKRAEDVRARIDVLSEIPEVWGRCLRRWSRLNRALKTEVNGHAVPVPNEEILIYQTMLGAWPLEPSEVPALRKRLERYVVKATREASVHTKWTRPNFQHERALARFVRAVTRNSLRRRFMKDFLKVWRKIAYWGELNSLSQLLIKIAAPGIPDFYQGSELWDFRLVDPDNRGPVDFEKRIRLLAELKLREVEDDRPVFIRSLVDRWQDGRTKLYVMMKALQFRRAHPELFLQGEYKALQVAGRRKEHAVAFLRHLKNEWVIAAAPRRMAHLAAPRHPPTGPETWGRTVLLLPKNGPEDWFNALTGETVRARRRKDLRCMILQCKDIFYQFPVALLEARRAG